MIYTFRNKNNNVILQLLSLVDAQQNRVMLSIDSVNRLLKGFVPALFLTKLNEKRIGNITVQAKCKCTKCDIKTSVLTISGL